MTCAPFSTHLLSLSGASLMNQVLDIQTKVFGSKELHLVSDYVDEVDHAEGTIVDVGCGSGDFMIEVSKLFPRARILGVDNNRHLLDQCVEKIARSGSENIEVDYCDIETDDLTKYLSDADVVYARYTIQHLNDQRKAMERICSFMKPGSMFIGIELLYPSYGEKPEGGVFTDYVARIRKVYALMGSEIFMSLWMPGILKNSGFDNIDMKVAFHSNVISGQDDFARLVISTAVFMNTIAPDVMTIDFISELERYMEQEVDKRHMYKATSVIAGRKV